MTRRCPHFNVQASGESIWQAYTERPKVRITQDISYEEQLARVECGLSLTEYDRLPGTPDWITPATPQLSKCHVLAWARLRSQIDAVYLEASKRG